MVQIAMTGSHKRGETCRQHFTRCNLQAQGIVSHAIKSFEAGIQNILGVHWVTWEFNLISAWIALRLLIPCLNLTRAQKVPNLICILMWVKFGPTPVAPLNIHMTMHIYTESKSKAFDLRNFKLRSVTLGGTHLLKLALKINTSQCLQILPE